MKNPPAFPQQFDGTSEPSLSGLSMRDYFAAKALQGLIASDVDAEPKDFAESSYEMADAMMKARGA
jgi:hypothetical protein